MSGGASILRYASPPGRHARTCSGHPCASAASPVPGSHRDAPRRGCPEQVHCCPVSAFQRGFRAHERGRLHPPLVTPDLIRGPGKPGEGGACGPRIGVRDKPGPRIKPGVTTGGKGRRVRAGRDPCLPIRRKGRKPACTNALHPVHQSKPDSSGTSPGMTAGGRAALPSSPRPAKRLSCAPIRNVITLLSCPARRDRRRRNRRPGRGPAPIRIAAGGIRRASGSRSRCRSARGAANG